MPENTNQIFKLWQKEQEFLERAKFENPSLFIKPEPIASPEILERAGIILPENSLPLGFLKFHPLDFVVEEIGSGGTMSTVDFKEMSTPEQLEKDQTVYADLVKVGISTIDAVKELSRCLNIEERQVGTAGIKDAIALTSQRISIRGASKEKFATMRPASLFLKNIEVGKGAMEVGGLEGNRFTILVRTEREISQEDLEVQLRTRASQGFWNFYWLQRFGNRLLSHWWGLLLFRGDLRGTVESYLCDPGHHDLPIVGQAREKAKTVFGQWKEMINIFSPFAYTMRHELAMLEYLQKHPNDFHGALKHIPEQIKLWVYAYVSYLFNRYLSMRIQNRMHCPETLPLVLSMNPQDREPYKTFLQVDQVPRQFEQNLRRFPFIRLSTRNVSTRLRANIHGAKALPEGVAISFDLEKGSYATTFLAHLFTLTSGVPVPSWVRKTEYDLKEVFGTGSLQETKKYLEKYIVTKEKGLEENGV